MNSLTASMSPARLNSVFVTALAVCLPALAACSKTVDPVHTEAFLGRFDSQRAECIRSTMKPAILDGVLVGMIASETAVDSATRLTGLAGCAPEPALRRGVAHAVVEAFGRKPAPYGIDASDVPQDEEKVEARMSAFAFDLAGRSRYRGFKRTLPGRHKVAYRSASGSGPTHELRVENIGLSGIRPEGWSADDVIGALALEAGPASIEGGRDGTIVWAVFDEGEATDGVRKILWGAAGGSMLYALEGRDDEILAAIVEEFAAGKGS